MTVMAVPKFERFFRVAGGLDVDKNDLKRFSDFVNEKIYDLLIMAQATAKANGRDVIEPWDLPITKGLQESIHRFEDLDEEIELEPILAHLAHRPQLDIGGIARPDVPTCRLNERVGHMQQHDLDTAPVTTSEGRLVGLLLREDAERVLHQWHEAAQEATPLAAPGSASQPTTFTRTLW